MLTTIIRIIRADWGAALEAAARAVVPAIALAYVAGMALGRWIHDLNDALAAIASRRPALAVAPAAPEPIAAALPTASGAPLALLPPAAVELTALSNRELMQLVGTRRKLPKRQLIALAVGRHDLSHGPPNNSPHLPATPMSETMQLKDAALWQRCLDNDWDPCDAAIHAFANRWALLMEAEIEKGATVADCAEAMNRQADTQGISGSMYGAAVSTLAAVWIHGEDLLRWHNRDCQIHDEGDRANESGGVLNPAVMVIS